MPDPTHRAAGPAPTETLRASIDLVNPALPHRTPEGAQADIGGQQPDLAGAGARRTRVSQHVDIAPPAPFPS